MIDHDKHIGEMLDLLDEIGIADNTFVMYSTDNGPHMNSWPDAGKTPFRNEKNSNWEGAFRVPALVRLPGKIKAGSVSNEIVSHLDWMPTILAVAGEPDIKEKLLKGHKAGEKTFKVHLDGYNLLPCSPGKRRRARARGSSTSPTTATSPACATTTGRCVFMEQRAQGTLRDLGRAVHAAAHAQDLQPAHRSLRTREISRRTPTTIGCSSMHICWSRRSSSGEVPGDLQGISAASEGGELQHRSGRRENDGRCGV